MDPIDPPPPLVNEDTNVECLLNPVRDEEYQQRLDEWAEIVYRHLSQLLEKKPLVPELSTPLAAEKDGS